MSNTLTITNEQIDAASRPLLVSWAKTLGVFPATQDFVSVVELRYVLRDAVNKQGVPRADRNPSDYEIERNADPEVIREADRAALLCLADSIGVSVSSAIETDVLREECLKRVTANARKAHNEDPTTRHARPAPTVVKGIKTFDGKDRLERTLPDDVKAMDPEQVRIEAQNAADRVRAEPAAFGVDALPQPPVYDGHGRTVEEAAAAALVDQQWNAARVQLLEAENRALMSMLREQQSVRGFLRVLLRKLLG